MPETKRRDRVDLVAALVAERLNDAQTIGLPAPKSALLLDDHARVTFRSREDLDEWAQRHGASVRRWDTQFVAVSELLPGVALTMVWVDEDAA